MPASRSLSAQLRSLGDRGFASTRRGYILVLAGSLVGLVLAVLGAALVGVGAAVLARQPGSRRYRRLLHAAVVAAVLWWAFTLWGAAAGATDATFRQLSDDGIVFAVATTFRLLLPTLVATAAAEWFAAEGFDDLTGSWRFAQTLLSVLLAGGFLGLALLLATQATTPQAFVDTFGPTGIAVVVVGFLLPYGHYLATLVRTITDLALNIGDSLAQR